GLAEQGNLQALAQLLFAPRLVEEHHPQSPAAIADDDVDHRSSVTHGSLRDTAHADEYQRLLAGHEIADARLVGSIAPSPRVRREEIEDGVDTDLVQRLPLLVADALDAI